MGPRDLVLAEVAIGANLGAARSTVLSAVESLGELPETQVLAVSALYRTAPFEADGPDFINAVVRLQTRLCAPDLLDNLQRLELDAGRERPYRHAPRTLDLDLLFYGEGMMASPALVVPHPRWHERAFVLRPLKDVAPERVTPAMLDAVSGQAIERLGSD